MKLGLVGATFVLVDPTGLSGFAVGLSTTFSGELLNAAGKAFRRRFLHELTESGSSLQTAFARAVSRALEDASGGNARRHFRKTVYADPENGITDSTLWNELPLHEREAVDGFFDQLKDARRESGAALSLTQGIGEDLLKRLLDEPESPEVLAEIRGELSRNALDGLPSLFQEWFLAYLNSRLQAFFWEELKQEGKDGTPAWRDFLRLSVADIRTDLHEALRQNAELSGKLDQLLQQAAFPGPSLESHYQTLATELASLFAVQRQNLAADLGGSHNTILKSQENLRLDLSRFAGETRKDFEGLKDELRAMRSALEEVKDYVHGPRSSSGAAPVALSSPVHTLPFLPLDENFTGRARIRKRMVDSLSLPASGAGKANVFTQPAAVYGTGGVGKTALAVEIAWELFREEKLDAALFVQANSPRSLLDSLAALVTKLDLPEKDAVEREPRVRAVLRWLASRANPNRALIILDNVDTETSRDAVYALLPEIASPVIITSRLAEWDVDTMNVSELEVFSEKEARDFLRKRLPGRHSKEVLDALSDFLGRHPLALRLAAAYLREKHVGPAEALQEWQARAKKNPLLSYQHSSVSHRYPEPLILVWQSSISELSAPALDILQVLSWLAPEPFPIECFDSLKESESEPLDYRDALARLANYSLLQWSKDGLLVTAHRLVQEVTRADLLASEDSGAELRGKVVDILVQSLPSTEYNPEGWKKWEALSSHLRACIGHHASDTSFPSGFSTLLNNFALWLFRRSEHAEAEPLMKQALKIDEAALGPEHPRVAVDLNNLAQLLQATNRLKEAEPLMERALRIDEAAYGPEHPTVARDLNNLAQLLQDTNRLKEAEPLMERALRIDEAALGPEHPTVAVDLNNLAQLLQATNREEEAAPHARNCLKIFLLFEARTGHAHPHKEVVFLNYVSLLEALEWPEERIKASLSELFTSVGLPDPGAD